MGDPHNNRWGSHENSWGHTSRNKDHKDKYVPSSFFNKIALGVCLFLCGAAGLSVVNYLYDEIINTKDKMETVKEVGDYITQEPAQASTDSTKLKLDITEEIDIDAGDVRDILDYIADKLDMKKKEEVIFVDYSAFDDLQNYKDKIINQLDNYGDSVVVIAYNTEANYTEAEKEVETQRIQDLLSEGIYLLAQTKYIKTNALYSYNVPSSGKFTVSVRYTTE